MSTLTDFVSEEESVLVRWEGSIRDGGRPADVVLGTTDDSVVFCSESGRFGLFPRAHVSAVECETGTVVEYDLVDYRLFVGGGALLSVTTFLGGILVTSGLASLVLLLTATVGLWLIEHGWRNRERYGVLDRRVAEVERVVVNTDAGVRTEFQFPAEADAGTELGRFVGAGVTEAGSRARRPSLPETPS